MFNKDFESLDKTAKVFLAATVSTIRELVRKHGKTCFEKACNESLKNPEAIIQWLTDKNTLQPTGEEYLTRQYLILTALHDDYIDRDTPPIYFTDEIEQNKETAFVHRVIGSKYYAGFREAERLKTEAYITDALKAVEADLLKQAGDTATQKTSAGQNGGNISVNIISGSQIGSVQAGVNNKSNSNAEQHKNTEKKKSVFWKIILWVVGAVFTVIITDTLGNFGWLRIIRNLLLSRWYK